MEVRKIIEIKNLLEKVQAYETLYLDAVRSALAHPDINDVMIGNTTHMGTEACQYVKVMDDSDDGEDETPPNAM